VRYKLYVTHFDILYIMPPSRDNPERVTYFAETDARGRRLRFGIKAKDRSRHMYVIGKTGMGKSTLLENLAIQDIQNGEGMAFIDPHGSSAERLLDYVPEERVKDVLYFAPFDLDNPVGFNIMEDVGYDKRHLVVSGIMSAFHRLFGEEKWSDRMEYILGNTLLALLEYPDATLIDVNRMYVDKVFRKKVTEYITDPLVKRFWAEEFVTYTDRYTQEATPAIQNKIGQFTSNPLVRNIIGQAKSSFDLRQIMDERKIFIVNLSKGRMGETNADLIGSLLTTKIYLAAMSRADLPEGQREKLPDFYFYVDEFQSVANDSFADILSEARKYKLALIIAHQYIEQIPETIRPAVFGNVGTTVTFRVGPFDAETLETVFNPTFMATDLVNLGFVQIYLTLMIDGIGSKPFSATTLPLIKPPRLSFRDQIVQFSRKTYARPRAHVEAEVAAHTAKQQEEKSIAPSTQNQKPSERREVHVRREFSPRPPHRQEPQTVRSPRAEDAPRRVPSPPHTGERAHDPKALRAILAEKAKQAHAQGVPAPSPKPSYDPRLSNQVKNATPERRDALREALRELKGSDRGGGDHPRGRGNAPTGRRSPAGVSTDELRKVIEVPGDTPLP
jgi:hypothetical protein